MPGWTKHKGNAVSLPIANIDTDQLIPARFMSVSRSDGYGDYLLHDVRRNPSGDLSADFPLNRHPSASILFAGPNFGSGSSREAAVYALIDAGFKAVAAPTFGDIFASNAVNNGLLPARLSEQDMRAAMQVLGDGTASVEIDVSVGQMTLGEQDLPFILSDAWRTKLMNGWDDIDLTKRHASAISAYRSEHLSRSPWRFPRG